MTVSSTTTKVSYSGDNSTTVFAYTFKIFDDDDITVILRTDATGSEAVQTKTTNYSVSGVAETGGGNITFVSPPASGITVVLLRETAQTQTTDYTPNDPFPASSHENALDKMTLIVQDQQEEINRALKLSRTNTMTSTEFEVGATTRANKILAFDDSGELAVTQEIGTFQGSDATTTTSNYNQRDIVKSTTAGQLNNVYICVLDSPSGTLLTNTTYWQLLVDAVSAATSATNAAASAAEAAADAILTAADVVSTNADVVLTNADVVSTNADVVTAGNSATAAQNAQAAAEAAFDLFDDAYLGAKASDPTLDNDGNALQDGALYFNTTDDVMKVYDLGTTTWLRLTPTVANQNNINTVAGISADVTAVAGNSTNINAVVSNATNINTVAADATDIGLVAGSIANVNTTAANIADVNNFASTYRIGATDPTTSLDEGDLFYNTTSNSFKYYNGSAWTAVESGLTDVVSDTTPQLGGNLDLNSNDITGTGDIDITGGLTTTGNVGIGTTSPSVELEIASSAPQMRITDTDTNAVFQINASSAIGGVILQADATGVGSNPYIAFAAGGTEHMRIDSSGKVAINKTAVAGSQTASVTGSTTLDFGTYQNFILTLTGSITLANPSTEQVGQSGFITFIQTGGYTVSLATQYETAGGAGITLSASGTDVVPYIVAASGRILLGTPQLAFA